MKVVFCRKLQIQKKVAIIVFTLAITLSMLVSPLISYAVKEYKSTKTVVIDAGHGGEDGGVVGVRTGVKESDLNLKIAFLLGECLKAGGFRVVYTRTSDTMRTHKDVKNNKKRADMFARGDIINDAKPSAVVSVHMNFYSSPSRRGAQVFFDKHNERSALFASTMQDVINRALNKIGGGREYSALSAEKYLLSCSPYPSIIVECGFLSNPIDERNLVDERYQILLAQTLYQGITAFLSALE